MNTVTEGKMWFLHCQLLTKIMAKILEDLKLTIIAGVVLTVVMIFVTEAIYDSQMSAPEAAAADMMQQVN